MLRCELICWSKISDLQNYPEIVFFIGLNVDVKTEISPLACSIACSSLRPTIERGGMLQTSKTHNHSQKKSNRIKKEFLVY